VSIHGTRCDPQGRARRFARARHIVQTALAPLQRQLFFGILGESRYVPGTETCSKLQRGSGHLQAVGELADTTPATTDFDNLPARMLRARARSNSLASDAGRTGRRSVPESTSALDERSYRPRFSARMTRGLTYSG